MRNFPKNSGEWHVFKYGAKPPEELHKVEVKGDLSLSYMVFITSWDGSHWMDTDGAKITPDRIIAWREVGE